MSLGLIESCRGPRSLPAWLRSTGCAFLYWLAFLIALEPGNVLHARSLGHALDIDTEVLRIAVAALLAAASTPVLLTFTRRFPLVTYGGWRNAVMHSVGMAAIALGLIVISCFLAAWILLRQLLPSITEVRDQLAHNWLLLSFGLGVFTAVVHVLVSPADTMPVAAGPLSRIPIKTRGRVGFVDIASVDWIETQGNYLALHTGAGVHLLRETLSKFEARLDPSKFVRIHRRLIVAVDRIEQLQPLANGDSTVMLQNGDTLRASRRYRASLRKSWAAHAPEVVSQPEDRAARP